MNKLEKEKFRLYSKTNEYKDKILQAKERIDRIFQDYNNPCLNYSGGKDSHVLMHLIANSGYSPDVYHYDNGLLQVPGSVDFVKSSVKKLLPDSKLFLVSSKRANEKEMLFSVGQGYNGFFGQYKNLKEKRDWDIRIIGIRAQESGERKKRFKDNIVKEESYTVAAPIYDLESKDIWTYILENNLNYHEIYNKQKELYGKIESRENRLSTVYDHEFSSLGIESISQFIYANKTNKLKEKEYRCNYESSNQER